MNAIKTFVPFALCAFRLLAQGDLTRHVDPYIGCSYNGHCFAAACVPFGMVQAGPDTGFLWWDYCSGYRYADTNILGFTQTHLSGTGCGDLGDLLIMPFAGADDLTRTNFASAYRKETQTAEPGFYAVTLEDNHAKVQVAAAKHAAIYEIGYQGAETPRLFVDLQHGILNWTMKTVDGRVLVCDVRQDGDRSLVGTLTTKVWVKRTCSFVLTFDRAITDCRRLPPRSEKEKAPRFVLSFDLPAGGTLKAKVAISSRSETGAKRNLAAEIPDWDLARVREQARAEWNAALSCLQAEGDADQLKSFYTSLYHLFIQPNNIADADEKPFYSTFSYWDTFRAAHPLYTIIAPEKVDGFVDSTLVQAKKQGYMPIWTLWGEDNHCMIGSHSIPVVVDAYLKGFRGFDAAKAYAIIRKSLTENANGRAFNQADVWAKFGYFPFDVVSHESVSRTLEHAYDDWCAARFAEALGEKDDAAFFAARANNWTNVFDRSVGFARGRDSKGNWRVPFSPFKLNVGGRGAGPKDFTEGNSWQYTWHVLQDPEGLMSAMGGKTSFVNKLNGLFAQPEQVEGMGFALDATGLIGQYAHGNEPSHHTAYLFTLAGRPDRTAEIVREVCDKFYRPEPEGLCGNDDCGQMSAWYLFSAMGFYPVNPCGGEYVIGAPQVPLVQVKVGGEDERRTFRVVAKNLSKENKYVKSVTLNGKPITDWKIRHAEIMKGGELVFEMTARVTFPQPPDAAHSCSNRTFCGVSSVAVSPSGKRLWATFYASPTGWEDSNNYIVLATSDDRGTTWRDVLVYDPDGVGPLRAFDSEVWVSPDGKLRWTYTERKAPLCSTTKDRNAMGGSCSDDRLLMFTLDSEVVQADLKPEPQEIAKGVMMCKPFSRRDGRWLLPVARWFKSPSALVYESCDSGLSYRYVGGVTLPKDIRTGDEHNIVELSDGRLRAYMRTRRPPFSIWQADSSDGGRSWESPVACDFKQSPARIFVRRLKSGALLLVKNGPLDRDVGRKNLMAYLSRDDGKTWIGGLSLSEGDEPAAYPDGDQGPDGTIYLTWDGLRTKRGDVHLARFTEEEVLSGCLKDNSKRDIIITRFLEHSPAD